MMKRQLAALIWISVHLAGMSVAIADQSDPRLPALFDRLRDASHSSTARSIEVSIWRIWGESGDARLDKLMAEAEAAMGRGDFVLARSRLDNVISAKPDFAEAWNRRATLLYLAGDYLKSLADIEQVLELEPRHFGALSGLGLVNLALSRDAAAIDAFQRVLSLYPANVAARQNLEAIERRLGESEI